MYVPKTWYKFEIIWFRVTDFVRQKSDGALNPRFEFKIKASQLNYTRYEKKHHICLLIKIEL